MTPAFDQSITEAVELVRDMITFNADARNGALSHSDADAMLARIEASARELAATVAAETDNARK